MGTRSRGRAPLLWDMHCHLDFIRNRRELVARAQELGLGILAVTVTPDGFEGMRRELGHAPNVRLGVGLHPWWVADGRCGAEKVKRAAALVRTARYVGELGLDRSPAHVPEGSLELQLAALEALAGAAAETSEPGAPKVLSLHSVRSAGLVLDVLERTGCLGSCACIFHWFTGSSGELHRAVRAGCYFSVNEMMLRTRRGREYARQLPAARLLLETDFPPGEQVSFSAEAIASSLTASLARIEEMRGQELGSQIADTALGLLGA